MCLTIPISGWFAKLSSGDLVGIKIIAVRDNKFFPVFKNTDVPYDENEGWYSMSPQQQDIDVSLMTATRNLVISEEVTVKPMYLGVHITAIPPHLEEAFMWCLIASAYRNSRRLSARNDLASLEGYYFFVKFKMDDIQLGGKNDVVVSRFAFLNEKELHELKLILQWRRGKND